MQDELISLMSDTGNLSGEGRVGRPRTRCIGQ
jgi:hypothetical protein